VLMPVEERRSLPKGLLRNRIETTVAQGLPIMGPRASRGSICKTLVLQMQMSILCGRVTKALNSSHHLWDTAPFLKFYPLTFLLGEAPDIQFGAQDGELLLGGKL